ncbi:MULTISPECIES: hypothetical protein [unclassified Pseudomonas]|uniref:XAC2610-related protein n=1 Tax=unclassified Pseudomonas TaxID=196821 RepID=UPI001F560DDC|nr:MULTISPECIES: hypothetical protein [unclassified Pseudomonas]
MRALLCGVFLSMTFVAPLMAEPRSFSVNDPSGKFLVEVLFPEVPEALDQPAPALITVRDKNTLQVLQQLRTPAANVPLRNGKTDPDHLVGEYGVLYFADIDFDGRQDLAIRNSSGVDEGFQYNYDVYLQDPQKTQWVLNGPLTELANANSGGMFSVNAKDRTLHSQTDRGCCWMRSAQWQMRDGQLVQLSAYTQEEVLPTEFGQNSSMPRGYMLRTTGEWKDGKWQETPRLEGPVNEDPHRLVGTLDGKIAVELWYQDQGAVVIGELRYLQRGSGEPIKLIGAREDYDNQPFLNLHEYTDDGHQTGIWRISRDYGGTWVSGARDDDRELTIQLRDEYREPDYAKLDEVARDQRDGHYQMRNDFLRRDGDLDLKILPERDAQGRELADITLTLKDTASAKEITTAHYTVPMETENLIIVREPLASPRVGPYHIQLVKNFAVIEHNSAPDSSDYFTGMYRKQP